MRPYQLRPYQYHAAAAALRSFQDKKGRNGIIILPTGAGKSLVIAEIASRADGPILVLQPSKEILEQNFAKLQSYGILEADVFSASVGRKAINRITFATIGSVMNRMGDFRQFRNVIIDECHLAKPSDGMYKKFIDAESRHVIGLTATPYRLHSSLFGSQLKFITRTRPAIFKEVLYVCQVSELLEAGFLARLKYYDCTNLDMSRVAANSTGEDYDERSLREEYKRTRFMDNLVSTVKRLMNPKRGGQRKGILVFTRFIEEAEYLANEIGIEANIVTGNTPKNEREEILSDFNRGITRVVANVGVLTTGFDYPELDTVVLARPTKSLSLYYQMVGRAIRPAKDKEAWVIDLSGTFKRFGKVEDLKVSDANGCGKWEVTSNGKTLTNVFIE